MSNDDPTTRPMTRRAEMVTEPSTDPEAMPAQLVLGERYEVLGVLGEGGMGEVHRVRDHKLNRVMAMKVLKASRANDSAEVMAFMQESQVTAQLQHPGIVSVHDMGSLADGRPYYTMTAVHGRTLSAIIREVHEASGYGPWQTAVSGWTFRRLVEVFRKTCDAVAYAHSRGVVHRDLKPSNVMVGEFGEVQVMDWGVAKLLDTTVGETDPIEDDRAVQPTLPMGETMTGSILGTLSYMAPEQARGEVDNVGPASDVYALGSILFQLMTGRPPFTGNPAEVLARVQQGQR
ncbi:MAG: serine/threonine-protein kinase, partial [Myxococcota bacterium]|nr:serine/threonine-protein kinase [Myxococcota bacterium]